MVILVDNISLIAIMTGIAVFFVAVAAFVVEHWYNPKNKKDPWLFSNWCIKLFEALFKDKSPKEVAKQFGVDASKYTHCCTLLGINDNLKSIVIYRIIGIISMIVGLLFTIVFNSFGLMIIMFVIAIVLIYLPIKLISKKLDDKRNKMKQELPRFLDMFYTALLAGLPVESAIKETCKHLRDTTLANEFESSLVSAQVGNINWQEALEKLAQSYDIDTLSDFILDLVTAYRNGTSITESVFRKSNEIKQSNLLYAKERAGKMTNIILFPVLLLKIVPLIFLIGIPVIVQLNSSGFGL